MEINTAHHDSSQQPKNTSIAIQTGVQHSNGARLSRGQCVTSVASTAEPWFEQKQLLYSGMSVITSCPVRLNKQLQISK